MRRVPLALLAIVVLGCAAQQTSVQVVEQPKEPLKLHPLTEDKEYIASQKAKAERDAKAKAKQGQPVKPAPPKIDPGVVGRYRLVLESGQQRQIDEMIKKMEADAAAGDQQAANALPLAKAAQEAARSMVVNLKPDGTYTANLGQGSTSGSFTMSKNGVILKPSVPSTDPNDPTDVEFYRDPTKKTLTVEFQGQQLVFAKNS